MPPKSPRQYKNIAVGNLNALTKKSLSEKLGEDIFPLYCKIFVEI